MGKAITDCGKRFIALSMLISLALPTAVTAKGKGPWEEHSESAKNALHAGDYESAERYLKDAMEDTRKFKDEDPRLGTTYFLMGQLNIRLQNYSRAKEYFERALNIQQKLLGAESLEVADSLYGVALCDQQLGDHLAAEIFLRRVHEIWRKKLSATDPKLISILPSMASYASMKNNFASAETYYKQLVDIAQASGNQSQLGNYMNLLAITMGNEGKFSEAKDYASRAVDLLKKSSESSIALDSAQDNLRIIQRKTGGESSIAVNTRVNETQAPSPEEQQKEKQKQERLAAEAKQKEQEAARARKQAEDAKIASEKAQKQIEASRIAAEKARKELEAQLAAEKAQKEEAEKIAAAKAKEAEEQKRLAEIARKAQEAQKEAEKKAAQAKAEAEQAKKLADANAAAERQQEHVRIQNTQDDTANASGGAKKPWMPEHPIKKQDSESQQWGKVRYLADGKLISAEEYKALLLANEAYDAMRQEKYRMAADVLNKALEIYPNLPSAHTNLGLVLARLGRSDESIEHLRTAIALDASRSAPWVNLASSFQSSGRLRDCVDTYNEYLRRFPNDSLASKARELVKNLQSEVDEQEAVQKAIASSGNSGTDYFPFTTAGGTVKWTEQKLPLKIFIASGLKVPGFKSEYQGIMNDAFHDWSRASSDKMKFAFVNKSEGADIECVWTNDYSLVSSPAEGGEAQVSYSSEGIQHVKIVILTVDPTPDSPLTQNQVQAVCLHEIGHALGLIGHSPNPSDIMYCSMPAADAKIAISPRDTSTIKHLYASDVLIALKPKVKKPIAGGDSKDDINNEGVELMSSKAYAQAIEKFETALKMDPNYELAKENLSRAYNNYALDLASKGKEQEAETLMQKAMRLKDSIRNATLKLTTMHNYAQLLRKLRREKEAASLEEEARAIDPKEAKQ